MPSRESYLDGRIMYHLKCSKHTKGKAHMRSNKARSTRDQNQRLLARRRRYGFLSLLDCLLDCIHLGRFDSRRSGDGEVCLWRWSCSLCQKCAMVGLYTFPLSVRPLSKGFYCLSHREEFAVLLDNSPSGTRASRRRHCHIDLTSYVYGRVNDEPRRRRSV